MFVFQVATKSLSLPWRDYTGILIMFVNISVSMSLNPILACQVWARDTKKRIGRPATCPPSVAVHALAGVYEFYPFI